MKARGKTYERKGIKKIRKEALALSPRILPHDGGVTCLPTVLPGPWIKFADANGPGHAQPDLLLVWKSRVCVVEFKLTRQFAAEWALGNLYGPLVQHLYQRPQIHLSVFRNVDRGFEPARTLLVWSLEELLDSELTFAEWHLIR